MTFPLAGLKHAPKRASEAGGVLDSRADLGLQVLESKNCQKKVIDDTKEEFKKKGGKKKIEKKRKKGT